MAEQLPLIPITKFTFRLPLGLHRRLKIEAVQEGRPVADILIDAIELYLSRRGRTGDDNTRPTQNS